MRCGKILVVGEVEEVVDLQSPRTCSKRPRRQQSRNSKKDGKVRASNPYSTRGLEKFRSLNEELAAKRVYVARKTGASEDLVRFCYTTKGWVPVFVRVEKSGGGDPRVSIPGPPKPKKDGGCEDNENGRPKKDDGCVEIANGCQNHNSVSGQPLVPWCGYVTTTAFGVLTVSALLARKSVLPAAAMAAAMVVCALQKRWQGGVMCMKKFILSGISYFSDLFAQLKNQKVEQEPEKIVQNQIQIPPKDDIKTLEIKKRPRGSLSVSTSLLKIKNDTHESSTKEDASKSKKKYVRIVSMDGQPRKPIRSDYQKSGSFNRRRFKKGGVGATVGASVIIIVLICLVFYGRIFAILVTSGWWYLLPKFKTEEKKSENRDLSEMDSKLRELRKKRVIMDGLLDRSHNNNNNKMRRSCML